MKWLLILTLLISGMAVGNENEEEGGKTVYKYKKYEKFDFDDMLIDGETGTPGDLSIMHRFQNRYKNRLPYRKNFNAEIKKGIGRIR